MIYSEFLTRRRKNPWPSNCNLGPGYSGWDQFYYYNKRASSAIGITFPQRLIHKSETAGYFRFHFSSKRSSAASAHSNV